LFSYPHKSVILSEVEGPEELVLPIVFRSFQPRSFRLRAFEVEKVRRVSTTYKVSGPFDFAQDDRFVVV